MLKNLFLASVTALLWALCPAEQLALVGIVFLGILAGIFFCLIRHPENFRELFTVFLTGLLIRVGLSTLFYWLSFFPFGFQEGFLFANDGYPYSENGWRILQMEQHGIPFDKDRFIYKMGFRGTMSGTFTEYDLWSKWVYWVLGKKPLALFLCNSAAGALPILFVYDLCAKLFSRRVARLAAWFAALCPSLIFWSTQNLREPFGNLAMVVILWAVALKKKAPGFYLIFSVFVASLVLLKVRWQTLPLFVIPAAIPAFLMTRKGWLKMTQFEKRFLILCAVIGLLLLLVPALQYLEHKYAKHFPTLWHWLHYNRILRTAPARTAFFQDVDIRSFSKLLVFLPIGLAYSFLAPFPWQLGSMAQVIGAVEMMVLYFLIPKLFKGLKAAIRTSWPEVVYMIFLILTMSFLYAVLEGNVGTLFRHRSVLLYPYFIFIAIGHVSRKSRVVPSSGGSGR